MRLWLLDADVIIDLLGLGIFDNLLKCAEVFTSSVVVTEVKFYNRAGQIIPVDFMEEYVATGLVTVYSASVTEIKGVLSRLTPVQAEVVDPGEIECLAILLREQDPIFCTCDAAAIRVLPTLGVSERGTSVEVLLKSSGLSSSKLKDRHTDEYFRGNLAIGQEQKVKNFGKPERPAKKKR